MGHFLLFFCTCIVNHFWSFFDWLLCLSLNAYKAFDVWLTCLFLEKCFLLFDSPDEEDEMAEEERGGRGEEEFNLRVFINKWVFVCNINQSIFLTTCLLYLYIYLSFYLSYNLSIYCLIYIYQGCRFSDFCRNSDFFRPSDFFFLSPPPPPPPGACIVCVTTMRANWWLSGQFWLRKSSSFKGALPPWTPTRPLPLDPAGCSAPRPPVPGYFLLFWTVPVASLIYLFDLFINYVSNHISIHPSINLSIYLAIHL